MGDNKEKPTNDLVEEHQWMQQDRLIQFLERIFRVPSTHIVDLQPVKKGLTNESFTFHILGKGKFVIRIPNEATSLLVNRQEEAAVYKSIVPLAISDEIIYIDNQTGIKVSKYIENAHSLDLHNIEELKLSLGKLKELHNSHIAVNHTFSLMDHIRAYEELRGKASIFPDYKSVRTNILHLLQLVDSIPKTFTLCHIDANCDNFLITDDKKVYLIDFEYAGMQDPNLDIAMICLYSHLSRNEIDIIINCYYDDIVDETLRYLIYSYIAIGGFLWSIWCEVKEGKAVLLNQYALRQYEYAITYYEIVQREAAELDIFK